MTRDNLATSTLASFAAALLLTAAVPAAAQVDITTQHNDNARTGANLSEVALTTHNVHADQFGKLFERAVDDQVYAQPLIVSGLDIPGVGLRNVLFVATVNNSVYAFDADNPSAAKPLWTKSYVNPAAGIVPVNHTDVGQVCRQPYNDFTGNIGIVGTPVIYRDTLTMYFVVRTKEPAGFVQRLHAVDILTGSEKPGSPRVIEATVAGTGDGHDPQNNISFNAQTENQRAALLLDAGVVYITWASHCDQGPYHGWILGYNAATLEQTMVFNTSPNGGLAGIWQSGQGLAADRGGYLYGVTGNGSFSGDTGGSEFGNSFLKISPSGTRADWFTPYNWAALNSIDQDLGIQGPLLVPGTDLVVAGGKQGVLYVLDRNKMGHFQAGSNSQIVQQFQASTSGRMNGSPVYWLTPKGPTIYLWPAGDPLKAFRLVDGKFDTTSAGQSVALAPAGMPGGILSLSANGSVADTGIVWAAMAISGNPNHSTQPGILRAYDASDVKNELWTSEQNPARDSLGNFAKFNPPTIANGKVYMATFSNKVVVYGALGGDNTPPAVSAGADQTVTWPATTVTLAGAVTDDGKPNPPGTVTTQWSVVNGPGTVALSTPAANAAVATFSTDGVYTLRLTASDGALTNADDVVVTVQGFPGTGLFGMYFNDPASGAHFTSTALARTDPTIDFNWNSSSPAPAVQLEYFSARWTGQVRAPVTGVYTFTTMSDDGVRVWVNGQLLIDNWTAHSIAANSGTIALAAGVKYDVTVEYFEKAGLATIRLLWAYPGQTQQVVPASALFPVVPPNQPPTVDAGLDQTLTGANVATLTAKASDDGLPLPPGRLQVTWIDTGLREPGEGGIVTFGSPNALTTTAAFSEDGTYLLRVIVTDSAITVSDDITVVVNGSHVAGGLYDGFESAQLDMAQWTRTIITGAQDLSVPADQQYGSFRVGPLPMSGSHYNGITSAVPYDLTGSYAQVEVVAVPSTATSAQAMFSAAVDGNNFYRVLVDSGRLKFQRKLNGVKTVPVDVPYSGSTHAFWRIRHDAATAAIVFETAPSIGGAPQAWTRQWSEVPAMSVTAMWIELKAGVSASETTPPGTVAFDNVTVASGSGASTDSVVMQDPFRSSLNAAAWSEALLSGSRDPSIVVQSTNGALAIGPLPLTAGYNGILSNASYDLTGAYAWTRVTAAPSVTSTAYAMFTLVIDANNHYRIWESKGSIGFERKVNGVKDAMTIAFDAAAHAFWRIRHDAAANAIVFETAPNDHGRPGAWTVRRTVTRDIPIASCRIELKAGSSDAQTASPGTVTFDDVRVAR